MRVMQDSFDEWQWKEEEKVDDAGPLQRSSDAGTGTLGHWIVGTATKEAGVEASEGQRG